MKKFLSIIILISTQMCAVVPAQAQSYFKGPALIEGVTTTATAAGTTTLTAASQTVQTFTGSTTQIVQLPASTTMPVGRYFYITNRSTGAVTVNNGAGSLLQTIAANSQGYFVLKTVSGTAGTWDASFVLTTVSLTTNVTGILPVANGGTGQSSFGSGIIHSNGTVLSSSAVSLTADVSGVLPLANGGTNANLTAAAGAVTYSTGSALALTAVGTSGQVLQSNGTSGPAWILLKNISTAVTSDSTGNERVERARISATSSSVCSVISQSGTWITGCAASGGVDTLTFTAFGAAPTCIATCDPQANGKCVMRLDGVGTTTTKIMHPMDAGTAGPISGEIYEVICMGPR